MASETIKVLHVVAEALERLGIRYAVGGSVASGMYGEPRSTHDVDLILDLRLEHASPLVGALTESFFIEEAAVREALSRRSSFQAVHRKRFVKVDLFVCGEGVLDQEQIERRVRRPAAEDDPRLIFVTSPEVIVLRKLDWFRMTDETSERQWRDVLGVLKVSGRSLETVYLRRTASRIGLGDLLERALREAGISSG